MTYTAEKVSINKSKSVNILLSLICTERTRETNLQTSYVLHNEYKV
jgi:hypothetical protein